MRTKASQGRFRVSSTVIRVLRAIANRMPPARVRGGWSIRGMFPAACETLENRQLLSAVNGVVFEDFNGDGVQDAGEPGIAGVPITSEDSYGQPSGSPSETTTASDGTYTISGLASGTCHTIRVHLSSPWSSTGTDVWGVSFSSEATMNGVNFGATSSGTATGGAFGDYDGDGVQGSGEEGFGGLFLFLDPNGNGLYDSGEPSVESDSGGTFTLALQSTTVAQTIRAIAPSGFHLTTGSSWVVPAGNPSYTGITFGVAPDPVHEGVVEGYAFWDDDESEIDEAEPRLAGWTVNAGGQSVTTDINGYFRIEGLPETINTVVSLDVPQGWHATTCHPMVFDLYGTAYLTFGFDSDPEPPSASIYGNVYFDAQANGYFDGMDSALDGWTVWADLDQDGALGDEPMDVTDANGNYTLENLDGNATYRIRAFRPSRWSITENAGGTFVYVGTGESVGGGSFGLSQWRAHGYVYNDSNTSGTRDEGEGMPSVTVWADLDGDGNFTEADSSTQTDASGHYSIQDIPGGTLATIYVILPQGYQFTSGNGSQTIWYVDSQGSVSFDFGATQLASVSGRVIDDRNGNGQLDPGDGDSVMGNIEVWADVIQNGIFDAGEPTTRTESDGRFSLVGLPINSSFNIHAVPPENWVTISANPSNYVSTGGYGSSAPEVDLGIRPTLPGRVIGRVYRDADENQSDENESPVVGWTVYLDSNFDNTFTEGERTTTTDGDGRFTFDGLQADATCHMIGLVVGGGWHNTTPTSIWAWLTSSSPSQEVRFGVNESVVPPAGTVAGNVYSDFEPDGAWNSQFDRGLANWTVWSDMNWNGAVDGDEPSTQTDAWGGYVLQGLDTTTCHYIRAVLQPGWVPNENSSGVTVYFNQETTYVSPINFGMVGGKVTGVVFHDADNDGVQSGNETGLVRTVWDDKNQDGLISDGEQSTLSGNDGSYVLSGLVFGEQHYIRTVDVTSWIHGYAMPGIEAVLQEYYPNVTVNLPERPIAAIVSVIATDRVAYEDLALGSEPPTPENDNKGVFTFFRFGGDTNSALTVSYQTFNGTSPINGAPNGPSVDYTLQGINNVESNGIGFGTVTFAAGEAQATIELEALRDGNFEDTEEAWVVIANYTGALTDPGAWEVGHPADDFVTIVDSASDAPDSSLSDQVGPDFNQRVDIHGVPLPDPSPTGDGEADRIPNMAYVDAYSLTPSFSTTDVAVPMPGGELVLEFRRTLGVNSRVYSTQADAALTDFQWPSETILGRGWSSNLGSRVILTATPEPKPGDAPYKATVIDEVGNGVSYASGDAANFVPDVRSSLNNLAIRGTLSTGTTYDGTTYDFAYTKKHGTTLFFSFVGAIQRGSSSSAPTDNYYRLARVVDRNGNELHYGYGIAGQPTLVTGISDPTESSRGIAFGYTDTAEGWRLTSAVDPLGRTHDYSYGGGLLTSVTKPEVANPDSPGTLVRPDVEFSYAVTGLEPRLILKSAGGDPWDSKALIDWVLPSSITDARGHTTSFAYDFRYMPTAIGVEDGVATDFWEKKPRVTSMTTVDGTAYVGEPTRTLLSATTTFTDTRGITTTYNFTGNTAPAPNNFGFGLVISQFSRSVNVLDADGNSTNKTVSFQYDGGLSGNLASVVDMSGNTVRFEYDSGEMGDAFNAQPYGPEYGSRYQIFGQPARSILDANGLALSTEYRYDVGFNKLVKQIDPAGVIVEYTLDGNGNRTEVIEGSGTSVEATTTYGYDSRGFVTSQTDADGRVTEYIANGFGNLEYTLVKGTAGEDLTPLESTSPYPSVDPNARFLVTRRVADVMDRTLSESDGHGNVTDYAYDDWDRTIAVELPEVLDPSWDPLSGLPAVLVTAANLFRYDYNSNLVYEKDQNGNVTTTAYDPMNRKTESRRRMDDPVANSADDIVSQWSYDEVGLVATSTDPLGRVTSFDYDALLRLIKTTLPQVTVVADPSSTSANPVTTTSQYTVKQFYGVNSGSGAFTFGGFNPTRVVNARGYAIDTQYDSGYRAVKTIQRKDNWQSLASTHVERAGEPTTITQYSRASKPIVVTVLNEDRNGVSANRSTYTFYDRRHRPTVSVLDFDGDGVGVTVGTFVDAASAFSGDAGDFINRSAYDGAGNAVATTDAEGRTTETIYDGASRPIEVQMPAVTVYLPDGGGLTSGFVPTMTTVYDANSNAVRSVDANGNKTASTYDARNRLLTTVLDLDGDNSFEATHGPSADDIVTRTGYDLVGNVVYGIDPNGNRTDTTFDFNNRPITVEGPEVADAADGGALKRPTTTTSYDKAGNAVDVTDARGFVTHAEYDELNRARLVTRSNAGSPGDADQLVTESRYDANNNVIASVVHNWIGGVQRPQVTATNFDPFDRQTVIVQPDPDRSGPLTAPVTTTAYSRAGDVLDTTDPNGFTTESTYDRAGRSVTVTMPDPDAAGPLAAPVTTTAYDKVGNVVAVTDPRNNTTAYECDALNRKVETTQPDPDGIGSLSSPVLQQLYDANGNATRVIDPRGNATITAYDAANRPIRTEQADPDGSGPLTQPISYNGYDANGNLVSATNPLGQTTISSFDALNRTITVTLPDPDAAGPLTSPVSQYGFDLAGNTVNMEDALGRVTTAEFDALSRKVEETRPDPDGAGPLAPPVTTSTYDAAGNVLTVTDAMGYVMTNAYDDLNRKVKETLPDPDAAGPLDSAETEWTYDAIGNVLTMTDPLDFVTAYTYDRLHRKTAETLPDPDGAGPQSSPVTTFGYDVASNLVARTDPSDNTTSYTYDTLNRQITETNELSQTRTMGYDAAGNVVSLVDRNDRERTYVYDNLNRQTAEQWLDSGSSVVRTITKAYDAKGRLVSASDPDSTTAYGYDRLDRLVTVDNTGTPGHPAVVLTSAYDAVGNRTSLSADVNSTADFQNVYVYDALNRLTSLTQSGTNVQTKLVNFEYNPNDLYTVIARFSGASATTLVAETAYGYDLADRLTSMDHLDPSSTSLAEFTWGFDTSGRIISRSDVDGSSTFAYDTNDQLLSADHTAQTDENYSYDANGNRTMTGYATGGDNRLEADGTYTYTHDGEGNRLARTTVATGEVLEYGWDHRNRLTSLTFKDASSVVTKRVLYTYDVNDMRIGKEIDADADNVYETIERYTLDSDDVIFAFDGTGTLLERVLQGPRDNQTFAVEYLTIAETDPTRVQWLLSDRQQTVRDVVDASGTAIDHLVYDSYGNLISRTSTGAALRFQYTGMEWDAESGQNYVRRRYYDAGNGRFVSQDPIGFKADDGNLYRYVFNDVMNLMDASGLDPRSYPVADGIDPNLTRKSYLINKGLSRDADWLVNASFDRMEINPSVREQKRLNAWRQADELSRRSSRTWDEDRTMVDLWESYRSWSDPNVGSNALANAAQHYIETTGDHSGMSSYTAPVWENRVVGGARAVSAGIGMFFLAPSILTPMGFAAETFLADEATTGLRQLISGQPERLAISSTIIQPAYESAGLDPESAAASADKTQGLLTLLTGGAAAWKQAFPSTSLNTPEQLEAFMRSQTSISNASSQASATGTVSRNSGVPTSAVADTAVPKVVDANSIREALQSSTMQTAQSAVSRPAVERYVRMLERGEVPPPIKVDGSVIVDGNHRYVAGRIFGKEPPVEPGTKSMSSTPRPVQELKVDESDWGNK